MTIKIITGHDYVVAKFVCHYIDGLDPDKDLGEYTTVGVAKDDKMIAGIIYNEYRPPNDIRAHIAVADKSWATKGVMRAIFGVPLVVMGCNRITAVVPKKNKKSQNLVRKMGFKYEGNLRQAMENGDDAIIYGMLKNECRWIKDLLQK